MTNCKLCDAEIFYARTLKADGTLGGLMPCDAVASTRAAVVGELERETLPRVPLVALDEGEILVRIVPTFVPHWSTCPHADEARRSKRERRS